MHLKNITGFECDRYQNLDKIRKLLPSSLISSFLVAQLTVQLADFNLEYVENGDVKWLMGDKADTKVAILYIDSFNGIMIQIRNFSTNEYYHIDIDPIKNHRVKINSYGCLYHPDHGVQLEEESFVIPIEGKCNTVENYFHEVRCYNPVVTSVWLGSPSLESPYTDYCKKIDKLRMSADYTRTMKASYDPTDGKVHGTINDQEFSLEKSLSEHFVILLEDKFYKMHQKNYHK